MTPEDFKHIQELLKEHAGWDVNEDKLYILDRRLTNLARQKNLNGLDDLLEDIKKKPKVTVAEIIEELAITDTSFNRDFDVYSKLERVVLPQLKNAKRGTKRIRFLSLGCSSGQEAYSIAMAVYRVWGRELLDWDIKIIGADINKKALNKAQRGKYSIFEVQQGLNIKDILANFQQVEEEWEIKNHIKKLVDFRECNIIDSMTFFDKFDLVACRNVMKYLCEDKRSELISRIYDSQPVGGLLYLGKGENIADSKLSYKSLKGFDCLYQSYTGQINKHEEAKPVKEEVKAESNKQMPSFIKPKGV